MLKNSRKQDLWMHNTVLGYKLLWGAIDEEYSDRRNYYSLIICEFVLINIVKWNYFGDILGTKLNKTSMVCEFELIKG